MSIEAMKQWLEALEYRGDYRNKDRHTKRQKAITSLRQAIAELESQEPVAKVVLTETLELPCLQWLDLNRQFDFKGGEYLYTHPSQRKPLTDEEKVALCKQFPNSLTFDAIAAIEAAHGIKE